MSSNNTDWNISADIYDIVETINNLKKQYVDDEDESTLATGIFGFIGDTEAKKIQTAVITTGILGNEMFPQRSKLDKNVITHAMYSIIGNLDAIPAHMLLNIGIREADFEYYASGNKFIFDRNCPMFVGKYEFHFDYDIILTRMRKTSSTPWYYNAMYDMSSENRISDIRNPYLRQPYMLRFQNESYIFFQAMVRQVTIETVPDKMITSSIIDNKSFTFTYENQVASFDVYITENNKTTRLKPLMYGSPIEIDTEDWCWYLYINDHTIRVGFDQQSYLPGLNAEIKVVTQTTLGEAGNFRHKIDIDYNTFFVDMTSEYYNYKKITCYAACATDSTDGQDKRSIAELKNLIPKMALSRGYITTETDLNNFFNLISTEKHWLRLQKKTDNQLNRIWYCYFLLKDEVGDVVPMNTLPIRIDPADDRYFKPCEQEEDRFYIPAGTLFKYNTETKICTPIQPDEVPELFSEEYFAGEQYYYYRCMYNIVVNTDPLYCAYYLPIINADGYFEYKWTNPDMFMGFVVTSNHFERYLLSKRDEYRLSFTIQQSIDEDLKLVYEDATVDDPRGIVQNIRVFLVIYQDGDPYRYEEAELTAFNNGQYTTDWVVTLHTDDDFDTKNRIKLNNLYEAGYNTRNYGYFEPTCKASIYIYTKFEESYGLNGSDELIPGMEGWTLTNVYDIADGLTFFTNFSRITNTRIRMNISPNEENKNIEISGIPLVGEHYFTTEDHVTYFLHELLKKIAYIDYCLTVLENNMDIDFKHFNTYGYSYTFYEGDKDKTSIGDIDMTMNFRAKLVNNGDISTKEALIQYIKSYIEDINRVGSDLHIPNMLHDIKEEFQDLIVYIEYMNYNSNRLGVNHIQIREVNDPKTVPEFISIRNHWNPDKSSLVPNIDLEIVTE